MSPLIPSLAGRLVADLVLVAVFAALHRRERAPYLARWAGAWALDAVWQLTGITSAATGEPTIPGMLGMAFALASGWLVLDGTFRFAGHATQRGWAIAALAVGGVACVGIGLRLPFEVLSFLPAVYLGVMRVVSGLVLLRAAHPVVGRSLAGVALLLWGVHAWNYPFLRGAEWFAPWGIELGMVLGIGVALGTLLLHVEQARNETRISAARYQELFDGAIEGFFRTSPRGRFTAGNPALVRILGYERESDLFALDLLREVYADPADRARILAQKDGSIDSVKVKRRDGSIIEVAIHGRRVRDEHGNVCGFEGSMRDVTEERVLREELEQAQRMEALGRMAGGIAHDFNNVLGTIVAAAELAKVRIARAEAATIELEDVRDSALRAADLTRQLLALARRQTLHRRPLDLRESVGASARVVGRVLGERIELVVTLDPDAVVVLADAGQIEQVVVNLALNARDAMPDGGRLSIEIARVDVEGGAWARLRVTDTGLGMTDEVRRNMFDPFFTTKRLGSGSGLGLAMVYGAVTQSGGRIEVESGPDRGTRIDVFFPIAPDAVVEMVPAPAAAATKRARTLLVEDEPALRRSVEAALRTAGHDVRAAAHAGEAFDRLGEWPLDLLITDVVMPGMSGPDLARAVRRRDPRCPVIFVTGYAAEPIEEALSEGAELLAKPFTIDALLAIAARRIAARAEPVDTPPPTTTPS